MPEVDIEGTYTKNFEIKKYNFCICNLVLHTSVNIVIWFYDIDNREVHRLDKIIEGEEYNAWGEDDSYLEELVDKIVKEFLNIA
jgi:hypothetical protein